jgi:hypothetical protein
MKISTLFQKYTGLLVALLIAMTAIIVTQSNSDLEQRVNDLENRVTVLEDKLTEPERVVRPDTRQANLENWRQLRERMRENQVRELLGEPDRIHGGGIARWVYPGGGMVMFRNGRVSSWTEPF